MPRMHVALGVGPEHADQYSDDLEDAIREAFKRKNVKAVGSCGLNEAADARQREVFARQVKLAEELHAPLVVEARGAYDEALSVLEECGRPRQNVILRAFDGTSDQLAAWVAAGAYISFGAEAENDPVSFCKLAREVPRERILVESGAPDATLIVLGGAQPRCDQVVFVADALQGVCSASRLFTNFAEAFS